MAAISYPTTGRDAYLTDPWTDPVGGSKWTWGGDAKPRWTAWNPAPLTEVSWDDVTDKPAPIDALSGTNTGDQDLSGYATTSALTSGLAGKAPSSGIDPSAITGTAVVDADSRLTNARTPTAHTHPSTEITGLAQEYFHRTSATVDAFSTTFVNGPNFVIPAGTYDFEIYTIIQAVGETSGAQYTVACSPGTDVSTFTDIRLNNAASLGSGVTPGGSFRKQTNAIGSSEYIGCFVDAPNNFACSHCRGSTVLASETTINLRIKQRTATDAVNPAQIAVGSFIRFVKR